MNYRILQGLNAPILSDDKPFKQKYKISVALQIGNKMRQKKREKKNGIADLHNRIIRIFTLNDARNLYTPTFKTLKLIAT